MATFFDVVNGECFVAMAIGFFQFTTVTTNIDPSCSSGIVFAVASGCNSGSTILALIMIVAGAGYAVSWSGDKVVVVEVLEC